MHMISASAPSDLAEYVDEGTLNAGTSLVTPAGMLVMQGNVAALRRALDARECAAATLRENQLLPHTSCSNPWWASLKVRARRLGLLARPRAPDRRRRQVRAARVRRGAADSTFSTTIQPPYSLLIQSYGLLKLGSASASQGG